MNKTLVTGVSKGLGKYLHENMDSFGLSRHYGYTLARKYSTIIHCAHSKDVKENLNLTRRLIWNCTGIFIYISSIDALRNKRCNELTSYARSKIDCETEVGRSNLNWIIIRPSSLMGTKPNSITKIVNGEDITLTADSMLNAVLYSDILDFIKTKPASGSYNIASNKNIGVRDLIDALKSKTRMGGFKYACGDIDNPQVKRTTLETIRLWKEKYDE